MVINENNLQKILVKIDCLQMIDINQFSCEILLCV